MVDDLRTFGCRKVQIGNDVKNVEHKHVEMLDGATSKMYSEGTVQWYDVSLGFLSYYWGAFVCRDGLVRKGKFARYILIYDIGFITLWSVVESNSGGKQLVSGWKIFRRYGFVVDEVVSSIFYHLHLIRRLKLTNQTSMAETISSMSQRLSFFPKQEDANPL